MQIRCKTYDKAGWPINGGCHRSNCPFVHPQDYSWNSAIGLACKFYDSSGNPIDGGCMSHKSRRCRFTHPDEKDWPLVRPPETSSSAKTTGARASGSKPGIYVKCKFYDDKSEPIDGGCTSFKRGECRYVHPGDEAWKDAPRKFFARPSRNPQPRKASSDWNLVDNTSSRSSLGDKDLPPTSAWDSIDLSKNSNTGESKGASESVSFAWGNVVSSNTTAKTYVSQGLAWPSQHDIDDGEAPSQASNWGSGWGASPKADNGSEIKSENQEPKADQNCLLVEKPLIKIPRDPRLRAKEPVQTSTKDIVQINTSSPKKETYTPVIPKQSNEVDKNLLSSWGEFIHVLRQAVKTQILSNLAEAEYQKAKRTHISETYSHVGSGARAILEDWRILKNQKKALLKSELSMAIDQVVAAYKKCTAYSDDVSDIEDRIFHIEEELKTLSNELLIPEDKPDKTPIAQPNKNLSLRVDKLLVVFEDLARDFEEVVSYSYDDGLLQRLSVQERDALEGVEKNDTETLATKANALKDQVTGLGSSFKTLLDQILVIEGDQVDKNRAIEHMLVQLAEQQDAYETHLASVLQMEAELDAETSAIASISQGVQRLITTPPPPTNQAHIPNPETIRSIVDVILEESAEDVDKMIQHCISDAKKISTHDAHELTIQLSQALKPAHLVIQAAHRFMQPRLVDEQ